MVVKSDIGPFSMIPVWVIRNASPSAVVVFGELASYTNNDSKICWPSHKTIAEEVNLSISTVKRSIAELVELGAVVKENRYGKDGSPTSNEYVLIFTIPEHINLNLGSPMNPPQVTHEPTSGHPRTEVGSPVSYKLEPINYNHITRTNELDLLPEQSSSQELELVKELTYEPIKPEPPAPKPNDNEWKALVEDLLRACSMNPTEVTETYWGAVGKAAKAIWKVGGRAGDCEPRARAYRALFSNNEDRPVACTPPALAKHWAKCTPESVADDATGGQEALDTITEYKQKNRFAHLEQKAIGQ